MHSVRQKRRVKSESTDSATALTLPEPASTFALLQKILSRTSDAVDRGPEGERARRFARDEIQGRRRREPPVLGGPGLGPWIRRRGEPQGRGAPAEAPVRHLQARQRPAPAGQVRHLPSALSSVLPDAPAHAHAQEDEAHGMVSVDFSSRPGRKGLLGGVLWFWVPGVIGMGLGWAWDGSRLDVENR